MSWSVFGQKYKKLRVLASLADSKRGQKAG